MLITRHCRQTSDDLITCERIMLRFMSGKFKPMSLDFNVWDHSLPEIYGIILGMFIKLGLVECLGITEGELLDFIIDVDRGYLATFYHSFYHAADVTSVLYHMLREMNASQYLSKPDIAALLLAGLCHDIGHPGLNNLFQVNAKTELVKQYGETSVLEKYSCSLAMELVAKHNLFRNVSKSPESILPEGNYATEESMKESMIKAIMATDMSFHYDMLNNLNTLIEATSTPSSSPSNSDSEATETESDTDESTPPSPTQPSCNHNHSFKDSSSTSETLQSLRARFECPVAQHHNHRRQDSTSSSASTSSDVSEASERSEGSTQTTHSIEVVRSPSDLTPELRQSLCNCLLHAADISNAVKPWALCKRWSDLVVQEFFRQGDIEKAQSLPVSPNMDRSQHNQPQISLGFGDFVVQPYFESFVEFLPEAAPFLVQLARNRQQWILQKAALEAEKATCPSTDNTPAVDTGDEVRQTSSPLPSHLTSGRRVSVAAGVLVLEDSRSQRPLHHRRLRHSSNNESSHHHAIRKIKRSLSGRALSSYLRDLHVHPRSLQTASKAIMSQDAVVSAIKREAALAGKEATVNLTSLNAVNGEPVTQSGAQEGSGDENTQGPEPTLQPQNHSDLPRPWYLDPGPTQYRQRRHGSLQLENKCPSIRQEYGDGYVILNHQDDSPSGRTCDYGCGDGDALRFIPFDPLSASPIPGAWPVSPPSADAFAEPAVAQQDIRPGYQPQLNLHMSSRHHVTSRSSTPAVVSGNIHYDWAHKVDRAGCGPLDVSQECMEPQLDVSIRAAATSGDVTFANGPASPILGAPEERKVQAPPFKIETVSPTPIHISTTTVTASSEDGPIGCVISTSVWKDDATSVWQVGGVSPESAPVPSLNGTISISAASAGPSSNI